jgi:hypothetical protein
MAKLILSRRALLRGTLAGGGIGKLTPVSTSCVRSVSSESMRTACPSSAGLPNITPSSTTSVSALNTGLGGIPRDCIRRVAIFAAFGIAIGVVLVIVAIGIAILSMPALLGGLADEVGLRLAHLVLPALVGIALLCLAMAQLLRRGTAVRIN